MAIGPVQLIVLGFEHPGFRAEIIAESHLQAHSSHPARASARSKLVGGTAMLLWILLGALYLFALFVLGLATLRKGHKVLFWVGIFLPFLWIIGALMHPTDSALTAQARNTLQQ